MAIDTYEPKSLQSVMYCGDFLAWARASTSSTPTQILNACFSIEALLQDLGDSSDIFLR